MERNSLNEALKKRASEIEKVKEQEGTSLDDSRRVKVLSPGRLVVKRFFRNRLAMVGLIVLIAMFVFCFAGPFLYEHGETEVFMHYDYMQRTYATATFNTDFTQVEIPGVESVPSTIRRATNSRVLTMKEHDADHAVSFHTEEDTITTYLLTKSDDHVYQWSELKGENVGTYHFNVVISESIDSVKDSDGANDVNGDPIDPQLLASANAAFKSIKGDKSNADFEYEGITYRVTKIGKMTYKLECLNPIMRGDIATNELATAIGDACAKNLSVVTYTDGEIYALSAIDEFNYNVIRVEEAEPMCIFTDYSFNMAEAGSNISAELKAAALLNLASEEVFSVDGTSYHVDKESGELFTADGTLVALMSDVRVVDSNAQDTFDVAFKEGLGELMSQMRDENQKAATLTWSLKQRNITKNEEGKEVFEDKLDEEGNPIFMDEELQITELIGTYTITRNMPFYVTDKYAPMSAEHPFGTDGNGMDIFARMMYGGRISLLVGFVVVILSMLIGVILGGIAGYFGGWVDTLIMRLVEIFYCIPSYPILIILGGYMDAARMDAISRLYVMMAVLGILSWAGIARLVRGQILSLREQEFMIATESTGVKVRHRIFRHLVPNVMPQLIVSATGSLGGVILTESSLSFLGLGVKFPLATWGNMIEFVTGLNENLGRYIYIWLPVGLLICFTVISFNFVGDGLRDAFDPKMKR